MRKMKPIDWICFSCVIALSVMAVLFSACNTPGHTLSDNTKDQTSVHQTITEADLDPNRPACPRCGSTIVIPIVYGLPAPELMNEAEQGRVHLGGCVLDSPNWHCADCGNNFSSENKPEFFN